MKKYSLDFRIQVLSMLSQCKSVSETCRLYGISRDTLYRWLRLQSQHGTPQDPPSKKYYRKLDPVKLEEYVLSNQHMMLKDYARHFGVSSSAIGDALRRLGITRKKRLTCIRKEMRRSEKYFWSK